jgi:hypothetical protein
MVPAPEIFLIHGINHYEDGRSCSLHKVCGSSLVLDDTVGFQKRVRYEADGKPVESCEVYRMEGNQLSCKVGYVPIYMKSYFDYFHGKCATVSQKLDMANSKMREYWNKNYGAIGVRLDLTQLVAPPVVYEQPEQPRLPDAVNIPRPVINSHNNVTITNGSGNKVVMLPNTPDSNDGISGITTYTDDLLRHAEVYIAEYNAQLLLKNSTKQFKITKVSPAKASTARKTPKPYMTCWAYLASPFYKLVHCRNKSLFLGVGIDNSVSPGSFHGASSNK